MSALSLPRRREAGRRRAHLRVVPAPRRRHTVLFATLFLVVSAGLVFTAVTLNALAAGDAVAAHELESRVADAQRHYAQLVAEVATLEDPERIRRVATEQLHLVPADRPIYLEVDRNLPADGDVSDAVPAGSTTDPLKPVLSVQR